MKFGRNLLYLEESSHCKFLYLVRILRRKLRKERNLKQGSWPQYKAAEYRIVRLIKDKYALKENRNYVKVLSIRDLGTNASFMWPYRSSLSPAKLLP
jgi:hypothetical protein